MCFMAGANSIFYGEKLLTTENPGPNKDMELFDKLGIKPESRQCESKDESEEAFMAAVSQPKAPVKDGKPLFYNAAD